MNEHNIQQSAALPASAGAVAAYLGNLGQSSRKATTAALGRIGALLGCDLADVPWHELRAEHVAAIRAKLADNCAPATANASLAALRGVLKASWRLGLMSTDDYQRAADVRHVPGSRLPAGRSLELSEVDALLAACRDGTLAGLRDAAMVCLLAGGGLRRSEAAGALVEDFDQGLGAVTVIGKGGKERRVFLLVGCVEAVAEWVEAAGYDFGPILRRVSQRDEILAGGMSDRAIVQRVQKRARQAGLAHFSPHDLRRSYITLLLDAGADLLSVQRLAGHAQPATTARYDRRGDKAAAKAAHSVTIGGNYGKGSSNQACGVSRPAARGRG